MAFIPCVRETSGARYDGDSTLGYHILGRGGALYPTIVGRPFVLRYVCLCFRYSGRESVRRVARSLPIYNRLGVEGYGAFQVKSLRQKNDTNKQSASTVACVLFLKNVDSGIVITHS